MRSTWTAGEGGPRLARFGLPISAVLLIAIPTFLARIVFLRELPVEQAARLVVFFAAVPLCAFVGNLGQSGVISREYSRSEKGAANWRSDVVSGALLITAPTLLAVVAVRFYNHLDTMLTVALAVSAICFNITQHMSMMLIATESFTIGNVLDRLSGTMLIVPALLVWLYAGARTIGFIVSTYTLMNVIILCVGFYILHTRLPSGNRKLILRQRILGVTFWLSSGISYLRENLLIMVIQPAVSPQSLAAFGAVSVFFRGFEIVRQPLSSVMLVDLTRSRKPAYLRRFLGVAAFGAGVALIAVVLVPGLLHLLYDGRYDQASWMIPWLVGYHVLVWLNSVPTGFIMGRSRIQTLTRYVRAKVLGLGTILLAGSILTYRIGFSAFLGTLMTAVSTETMLGYGFLIFQSRIETNQSGNESRVYLR